MRKMMKSITMGIALLVAGTGLRAQEVKYESPETVAPLVEATRQVLLALPAGTLDYAYRAKRVEDPTLQLTMAQVFARDVQRMMEQQNVHLRRTLLNKVEDNTVAMQGVLVAAEQIVAEEVAAQPEVEEPEVTEIPESP